MEDKRNPFSQRLLSTFDISDEILIKLKSKGFTVKSEIENLSDSKLKSICDLNDNQLEAINEVIRKSHKRVIQSYSIQELLKISSDPIHTGSYSLDFALEGGLQISKIIQISGEGGAGKTQICMQCCVNVQLPTEYGGLSGQALYIDTENNFRPERIVSMAKHRLSAHPDLMPSLSVETIKSGIHLFISTTNAKDFVDLVVNKMEAFIEQNPKIKLVVIDSIAQHFRYDYKGTDNQKDYELSIIAHSLRKIAFTKKVAVLIANQVTFNPNTKESVPALGKYWQTNCNIAILLNKLEIPVKGGIDVIRMGNILRSNQTSIDLQTNIYFKITENGIEELLLNDGKWHPDY